MILRLAFRNLFRNRWRSALTAGGIATAVALLTWTMAMMDGLQATFIRGATAVEIAQIQINHTDYAERPNLFRHFAQSPQLMEAIEGVPEVQDATGRCVVHGLVGHERRSQVARIVGIDPTREARVTLLQEGLETGRWLASPPPDYPAPREALLGQVLAEQLGVTVGDELVLFLQAADGSLGNDLIRVVGILRTGSSIIDRGTVYLHLQDVQYIAALEGRLHEISIRVDDLAAAPRVAGAVSSALADFDANGPAMPGAEEGTGSAAEPAPSLVVRPWQEILPDIHRLLELYDRSLWITYVLVFGIVALGILNTQRMSALERRREFGVLKAIGLSPGRLGRMIVVETVVLTMLGALVGAAAGLALSLYHAEYGLDMSAFSDQASFSMMGVAFSQRLFFVVEPAAVTEPLIWTVCMALLCGLWPALSSARLNAPQAISGRTD